MHAVHCIRSLFAPIAVSVYIFYLTYLFPRFPSLTLFRRMFSPVLLHRITFSLFVTQEAAL